MGGPRTKFHTSRRFSIAERRTHVSSLRLSGMSVREIATALGLARSTVSDDLQAVEKEWVAASVATIAKAKLVTLARLDRLLNACWSKALRGDYRAVDAVLQIERSRRQLLHLDSPHQQTASATTRSDTTTINATMATLPDEARVAFAAAARAIEVQAEAERVLRDAAGRECTPRRSRFCF
jgi:transposase